MLNHSAEVSLSKFMTKLLRHTPQQYGLILDPEDGSCLLEELLAVINAAPKWSHITEEDIRQTVTNSEKQRFAIEGSGSKRDTDTATPKLPMNREHRRPYSIMALTRMRCRRL